MAKPSKETLEQGRNFIRNESFDALNDWLADNTKYIDRKQLVMQIKKLVKAGNKKRAVILFNAVVSDEDDAATTRIIIVGAIVGVFLLFAIIMI